MSRFIFIYVGLVFLLFIGYQNCSQKSFSIRSPSSQAVDDQNSISDGGGTGNENDDQNTINDDDLQDIVNETKINCDNALSQNRLITADRKIVFEDTKIESGRSQVCRFGEDLNLGMNNTFMQARYEQAQTISLPANAVICDLEMTTPLQRFRYDDVFVFTYNDRILATNNKTALFRTTPENTLKIGSANVDIYKYNWLDLRTLPFDNVVDDYCLGLQEGAASCQWPLTEQSGNIQFDYSRDVLIALASRSSADNQTFGFVITGDNDPNVDCYHERLEFDISVKYYLK